MTGEFVPFDRIRERVSEVLRSSFPPETVDRLYVVRDLRGKVRICVSDAVEADEPCRDALQLLANGLYRALGAHAYPADQAVLFLDSVMLNSLHDDAREFWPGLFWVDRQVTGRGWSTVGPSHPAAGPRRYTLFSVKGGVGRSTTAVMLAWRLAHQGERVLVVDLDLESPGFSSAMLGPANQPEFGVTDWFAEDLVGQADSVTEKMTVAPSWAHGLEGDVRVAPAHGREPGEYLAKLGRAYMDTGVPWTQRLERLLARLETVWESSVVLLESRSGLHDIAAATVTDLDAQVLLFTIDSASHWTDYRILFRHWQHHDLAQRIRNRLSIVSALTPDLDTQPYLLRFREQAWNLFRDHLYDDVAPANEDRDSFSFDLFDEDAPHDPAPIHWTRGLAAGTSLVDPGGTPVEQAYWQFFERFDRLTATDQAAGPEP